MAETRAELYAKWTTEDVKRFRAENAQLQRDLAQARTEAAKYRAALERLCRCMERDPDDGVCLAHHVLNGGEP